MHILMYSHYICANFKFLFSFIYSNFDFIGMQYVYIGVMNIYSKHGEAKKI